MELVLPCMEFYSLLLHKFEVSRNVSQSFEDILLVLFHEELTHSSKIRILCCIPEAFKVINFLCETFLKLNSFVIYLAE